jgi:hypothetical protein
MNGIPLFMPYCLRSKAVALAIVPRPVALPVTGDAADGEIAVDFERGGPGLDDLRGSEGDE